MTLADMMLQGLGWTIAMLALGKMAWLAAHGQRGGRYGRLHLAQSADRPGPVARTTRGRAPH